MSRCTDCHRCGYFKEKKRKDGSIRNYYNDLDCTVDSYEPPCSEENYES